MPSREHMETAIRAAKEAHADGDYSVGAVVALGNRVLATGGNRTHVDRDSTQHAEMIAIRKASATLGSKDLSACTLYSTHEPCPMCMGAVVWARIGTVVFGATMEDHKRHRDGHGNETWPWRVIDIPAWEVADRSGFNVEIIGGYMRDQCLELFHE